MRADGMLDPGRAGCVSGHGFNVYSCNGFFNPTAPCSCAILKPRGIARSTVNIVALRNQRSFDVKWFD